MPVSNGFCLAYSSALKTETSVSLRATGVITQKTELFIYSSFMLTMLEHMFLTVIAML
jgi:hypothetical protein